MTSGRTGEFAVGRAAKRRSTSAFAGGCPSPRDQPSRRGNSRDSGDAGGSSKPPASLEILEERWLLSLFGGETFTFTDLRGATATVSLRGNIVATLIGTRLDQQGVPQFFELGGTIAASTLGRENAILGDGAPADLFAIHIAGSDERASIAIAGPQRYAGSIGAFAPLGGVITFDTGQLLLGTLDANANPILAGSLAAAIGTRSALIDDLPGESATLSAGVNVTPSLQRLLVVDASLDRQVLLSNIDIVRGLSVSQAGAIVAIDTDGVNALGNAIGSDELVLVDRNFGFASNRVEVKAGATGLRNVQALDFGRLTLGGAEQLFAVYDRSDGAGPQLGTIDSATGQFTSLNAAGLGLGVGARVAAMAFSANAGSIAGQPGLFVAFDPDINDGDETLFLQEVNAATGAVIGAPVAIEAGGQDVRIGSMDFDAQGRLIAHDAARGRLVDVNTQTGVAGEVVASAAGTVNATVGAIAFDPLGQRFLAADNVTGQLALAGAVEAAADESAIVMTLADPGSAAASTTAQHLGGFLFDGIATGQAIFSGSVDLAYFGWALFGEARLNGQTAGQPPGAPQRPGNFTVAGDLRNLITLAGMGADAIADRANAAALEPAYYTGLDLNVGGRLGQVRTLGSFAGHITVNDDADAPLLTAGTLRQREVERFDETGLSFADGFLTGAASASSIFHNNDLNHAQHLGTIRAAVTGQGDVVHLQGALQAFDSGADSPVDPVDYYAVPLLAGQSITVQVRTYGATVAPISFAIFDADGRLIASDYSNVDAAAVRGQPIRITADRPGTYFVAVALTGDTEFDGQAGAFPTSPASASIAYDLLINDAGSLALGALVADGGIFADTGSGIGSRPAIAVNNGDLGAVIADSDCDSDADEGVHLIHTGAGPHIRVSAGSIRQLQAGSIGYFEPGDAQTPPTFTAAPTIEVAGAVGLLRSTATESVLAANFAAAAGGNIQVIDAAHELGGAFRTNASIGLVRAGQMTLGTAVTLFEVDADNAGAEGTIDLIDVENDLGHTTRGGPGILTHGGNVLFLLAGGQVFQDTQFAGAGQSPVGVVTHARGAVVTMQDDGGAMVTLTPGKAPNPAVPGPGVPLTVAGQLTTTTYGIRDSGGVVLVNVATDGGVTVSADGGAALRTAEISRITTAVGGNAVALAASGMPVAPAATAASPNVDIIINSKRVGSRVDVLDIAGANTNFNSIANNTRSGRIISADLGTVGTLSSAGSLGLNAGGAGPAINPRSQISNVFPFVDQRVALSASHVVTVRANEGLGNIIVDGSLGNLRPNFDNLDNAAAFEGVNAPVFVAGQLFSATIGEGLLPSGSGAMAHAGLFAVGRIHAIAGSGVGRDIRGDVVSMTSIGSIALTGGAVINADILVADALSDSREFDGVRTYSDDQPDTIAAPRSEIGSLTLTGTGGIIGALIGAADVGAVTITGGFGILNSRFEGRADAAFGNITAGGYGLRDVAFSPGASLGHVRLTGTGAAAAIATFSSSVRQAAAIDPFFGTPPNRLTDLSAYLVSTITGLATGVIEHVDAAGTGGLGAVTAHQIHHASFHFAGTAGGVTTTGVVRQLELNAASLPVFSVGGSATDVVLAIAGDLGVFSVRGSVLETFSGATNITTTGVGSDITSISVTGDFTGDLDIAGRVNTITIGSAADPASGDFTGNLRIRGQGAAAAPPVLSSFTLLGSFIDGVLDLNGNVGTISANRDFGQLGGSLLVRGNLAALRVGLAANVHDSALRLNTVVEGNLSQVIVQGALTGDLAVKGNLASISVAADVVTRTSVLGILTGDVSVGDTLTTLAVNGNDVRGAIVAGRRIVSASIVGGDLSPFGQIVSALGDVTTVAINGGDLLGRVAAPLGRINTVSVIGAGSDLGPSAVIESRTVGAISIAGSMIAGARIEIDLEATSVLVGVDVETGATIDAGSLATLRTTRDLLGDVAIGFRAAGTVIAVGRDFAGSTQIDASATMTVGRDFGTALPASLKTGQNLNALTIAGVMRGDALVDGGITRVAAASMSSAVITAGFNIGTVSVTGAVSSSLIAAGRSRGDDGVFSAGDASEGPRMADVTSIVVGSITNSIIAAGGTIGTFNTIGAATNSSISAGLVLDSGAMAAVIADDSPLADEAEQDAGRANATLFHGSISLARAGTSAVGWVNSDVTAGVSAGADGRFGTGDDNVVDSLTGGRSRVVSLVGGIDAGSNALADLVVAGAPGTAVDFSIEAITANHPLPAVPTAIATSAATQTIIDGSSSLIVKITGAGQVQIFDDPATDDRVDTLVVTGGNAATTITLTTSNADTFGVGRILMTDDAQIGTLTFNGDLKGDGTDDPDLVLEGDLTKLQFRNMPDDRQWRGQIGGRVATLTMNAQGPGRLTIGGAVTTLTIVTAVGDAVLELLGPANAPPLTGDMVDLATNSLGDTLALEGGSLVAVNVATGAAGAPVAITRLGLGGAVDVRAIDFDAGDVLYGVATIVQQAPTVRHGVLPANSELRGLAVNSTGRVFAIDSSTGVDRLVELDADTGSLTVIGTLNDIFANTFANHVLSLAFADLGGGESLFAVLSDSDGTGNAATPATGVALARIETDDANSDGVVRVSNPTASGGALPAVAIDGDGVAGAPVSPVLDGIVALATRPSDGALFGIRRAGGSDVLVRLQPAGNGGAATVTLTTIGAVQVDGAGTTIIGMGFDESDSLVAVSNDGMAATLIRVVTTAPGSSFRIMADGAMDESIDAFAFGASGANFTAFGYDDGAGGALLTSPGLTPTLGVIDAATGIFSPLVGMARDANGTPVNAVRSIAVDRGGTGDVLAVSDDGELLRYNPDGTFDSTLGTIIDAARGKPADIRAIASDGNGGLVGLDRSLNRAVQLSAASANAVGLSDPGTIGVADLVGLDFDPVQQRFVTVDAAADRFVAAALGVNTGIVANAIASMTVTGASYNGRVQVTGGGSSAVRATGAGDFRGSFVTAGSISSFTKTGGGDFAGALLADGSVTAVTVTGGDVGDAGLISAGNAVSAVAVNATGVNGGNFAGALSARSLTSFTVARDFKSEATADIEQAAGLVRVTGAMNGSMSLGSAGTFITTGTLAGEVSVDGDVVTTTLSGGTAAGSSFIVHGGLRGATTVGGTHRGLLASQLGAATIQLANVVQGTLAIGMDAATLVVTGDATNALFSFGVWLGDDETYNTVDDVITGGTLRIGTFSKTFFDSVIAAGVLPRADVALATDSAALPADRREYVGNPDAALEGRDAVEAGGALPSRIDTLRILGAVTSSVPATGRQSVAVTADDLGTVTAGEALVQRVLSDPPGGPKVTLVQRVSDSEIRVALSEQVNTAALVVSQDSNGDGDLADAGDVLGTVSVRDAAGSLLDGITLDYATQATTDGEQGVLRILRAGGFGGEPVSVVVETGAAPAILDRTGMRSLLNDFNRDGVVTGDEDPFGTSLNSAVAATEIPVTAFVTGDDAADDFVDALAGALPLELAQPLIIVSAMEGSTDLDVFRFTGAAGHFVSVAFAGDAPASLAVFVRDDQGTGDASDDTFELLARPQSNVGDRSAGGGDLFAAFELPESGEYFIVVEAEDGAVAGAEYLLTVTLAETAGSLAAAQGATLDVGGAVRRAGRRVDPIAYLNNSDNPAKQLVFVAVTGGLSTGFIDSRGIVPPFAALDAGALDSRLAGLTQTLIDGSTGLGVTGFVDVLLGAYAPALAGDVHRISNLDDRVAFEVATTGLWVTTNPGLLVGLDPAEDFTTIFVGAGSARLFEGQFGAAGALDVANLDKADDVLVFADAIAGLSGATSIAGLLNDYSLALGNVAARYLGEAIGLSVLDRLTIADAPSSPAGVHTLMGLGGAGLAGDVLAAAVLGAGTLHGREFRIGSQDSFTLIGRWLR